MDYNKVQTLLRQWDIMLDIGEHKSKTKASKNHNGLMGRIKRSSGRPVIFDIDAHENQKEIQNSLCSELPELADIIRSVPEIMDGYRWTRKDFIELYFEHFRLVVEKITRIVSNKSKM